MSQIARLHSSTIVSGHTITASDLSDEFNQLVSESNAQDTRLTNIESQAVSWSGVKTFTSGIIVDNITERSTSAGVTIAGVNHSRLNVDRVVAKTTGGAIVFSSPITLKQTTDPSALTGEVFYSVTGDVLKYYNKAGSKVSVAAQTGRLIGVTAYTSGSNTYTPPAGTTALEIWSTGGGGSGGYSDNTHASSGGSAGATAYLYYTGTIPATLTAVVGGGGAAQSATGSSGNDGVDSTVAGSGFTTITGGKGKAGLGANAGSNAGVVGGTASNGTLNIAGGDSMAVGSGQSSCGAASFWGGGGRGGAAGSAGVAYGSGGGGGFGTTSSGAGAGGVILIKAYS